MGIGNLPLDDMDLGNPQGWLRAGGNLINKGDKEREDEKADKSSEDIKEAVGEGCALGGPVRANAGEDCGMVVPILSPKRIGTAVVRGIAGPSPSTTGCEARLCKTPMVALLLWTTMVMTVPMSTPKRRFSPSWVIHWMKMGLSANGFNTCDIVFNPMKRTPKPKTTCPRYLSCFRLPKKKRIKPIAAIG